MVDAIEEVNRKKKAEKKTENNQPTENFTENLRSAEDAQKTSQVNRADENEASNSSSDFTPQQSSQFNFERLPLGVDAEQDIFTNAIDRLPSDSSFASYNSINDPINLRITSGSSQSEQTQIGFVDKTENQAQFDLNDVYTPEELAQVRAEARMMLNDPINLRITQGNGIDSNNMVDPSYELETNQVAYGQITPDQIQHFEVIQNEDQTYEINLFLREDGEDRLRTPPPLDENNLRNHETSQITVENLPEPPNSGIRVENLPDLTPGSGYNDTNLDMFEQTTGITVEEFDHPDMVRDQMRFVVDNRGTKYYLDQASPPISIGNNKEAKIGVTTRITKNDEIAVSYYVSGKGLRIGPVPVSSQLGISGPGYNPLDADRAFARFGAALEVPEEVYVGSLRPMAQAGVTFQYDSTNPSRPIKVAIDYRAGVKIDALGYGPETMVEDAIEIEPYFETQAYKSSPNKPSDVIKADYNTERYYGGLIENNGQEYLDTIGLTQDQFQQVAQSIAQQTNRSLSQVMSEMSDALDMAIEDFNEARQGYGLSIQDSMNVSRSYQNGFEGSIDDIINAPIPEARPENFADYATALEQGYSHDVASYIAFQRGHNVNETRSNEELASEYFGARDSNASIPANFIENPSAVISEARANGDERPAQEVLSDYYQGAGFTAGAANRLSEARLSGDTRPLEDVFDEYHEFNDRINDTTSVIEQRDYDMFANPGESQWDFEVRQHKQSDAIIDSIFGNGSTNRNNDDGQSSAESRAERAEQERSYSDRGFSDDTASEIADAREDGDHRTADDIASEAHGVKDDDASESSNERVICTYFYQKGVLSRADWVADLRFTAEHLPRQTVRGYHIWAIPTVRLMKQGGLAGRLLEPFMCFITIHRARELAHKMGRYEKGDVIGKVIRFTMEPMCWILGLGRQEQDWQRLYKKS